MLDVGPLAVALLPAGEPPVAIGAVNYRWPAWYEQRAGIQVLTLTPEQLELAAGTPLGIVRRSGAGLEPLAERGRGRHARARRRRLLPPGPGVPASTTRFAAPAAGQRIELTLDSSVMQGQVRQGVGVGPAVGRPTDALGFPASVTTGDDGTVVVTLGGSDPGNPRGYIDGQVYGVRFGWAGADLSDYGADTMSVLSVLLWDASTPAAELTWMDDVQPILQQYADLYPVMRKVLDLDDFHSVLK